MLKNQSLDKQPMVLGKNLPSLRALLIISIGLIILTIVSFSYVYAETISVDIDGVSYDFEYSGHGVTVLAATADLDFVSLILDVNVPSTQGTLEITFERGFFDSLYQDVDEDFIVLADGDEPTYSEIERNSISRTLSITLPAGTEEVEIIGSVFGQEPPTEEIVVCTREYDPVCGVDGITYSNRCMLDAEKIEFDHLGECITEEPEPVKEPTVEEPEPVKEPTVKEPTTTEETPKVECGEGTILQDGVCVLDERCGPGTILQDGVCVIEETTTKSAPRGMGTQLIYAVVAGFIIAGIVGLVLALMSKASKSKN